MFLLSRTLLVFSGSLNSPYKSPCVTRSLVSCAFTDDINRSRNCDSDIVYKKRTLCTPLIWKWSNYRLRTADKMSEMILPVFFKQCSFAVVFVSRFEKPWSILAAFADRPWIRHPEKLNTWMPSMDTNTRVNIMFRDTNYIATTFV